MWPLRAGTFLNFLLHMPHSTGFPDSVPVPDADAEDVTTLSNDFCLCSKFVEFAVFPTGPFGGLRTAASAFAATRDTDEIGSPMFADVNVALVLLLFV